MAGEYTPTLRRRELAARLRALRHSAGLTLEEVARELRCSPTKISRMETGRRGVILHDVRELCRLYRVSPPEQEDLLALARQSKERTWWQGYEIDATYRTLIGLESAATAIADYQALVVPGLLQTPEYARAILRGAAELRTEHAIEENATLRTTRQQVLDRTDPPEVSFILDEAVIHRLVGSREVMRRQLDALLAATARPHVSLQIMDYDAGAHPALRGSFTIVEIEGSSVASIVYVEGHQGDLYLDGSADLRRYRGVFARLRSMALSPQKSLDFIARVRDQLGPPEAS